jgi:hypothetical protein
MHQGDDFQLVDRRAGDRRRRRSGFVMREKRTGFDRRGSSSGGTVAAALNSALVSLRDRPRLLRVLLVVVNALNVADFVLTLRVLNSGGGEANLLMRTLFDLSPVWAGLFKIAAVLLVSLLLWRCRCFRDALTAALAVAVIFAGVILYHIFGLVAFG